MTMPVIECDDGIRCEPVSAVNPVNLTVLKPRPFVLISGKDTKSSIFLSGRRHKNKVQNQSKPVSERNIWFGVGYKPESRLHRRSFLEAPPLKPLSAISENDSHRGHSIEVTAKEPVQSRQVGEESSLPSRRAMSVDGDAAKSFDTTHIIRPQYMDISNLVRFHEELGRGAFGIVRKCKVNLSGQIHACKTILKSNLKTELDLNDLKSEVLALQTLHSHPNVIKLNGVFEDSTSVHLLMDYCKGGDLFDRFRSQKSYSESRAAEIIQKLASVLAFAHDRGIIHRDIKPENILMVSYDPEADIRLADFGSAAMFRRGQKLNQLIGSPMYVAPSVLQHNYGPEADIWSLGVLMYILISGVPPFLGRNNVEIFRNIKFAKLNLTMGPIETVSADAKHLLSLMLNRNTEEAISAANILKHPWIVRGSLPREPAPLKSNVLVLNPFGERAGAPAMALEDPKGKRGDVSAHKSPVSRRRNSMGMFNLGGSSFLPLRSTDSEGKKIEGEFNLKSVLQKALMPYREERSERDDVESGTDDEEEAIPARIISLKGLKSQENKEGKWRFLREPGLNDRQPLKLGGFTLSRKLGLGRVPDGQKKPSTFGFFKKLARKLSVEEKKDGSW